MQDESVKKRVQITIEPEVHDTGVALAKDERRSFSNLVEVLITKELQRRGVPVQIPAGNTTEGKA